MIVLMVFALLFSVSCSEGKRRSVNPFFSMTGKEASVNLYLFDGETTHTYLVENFTAMVRISLN